MSDERIAQLEAEVAALRQQVNEFAEVAGAMLGTVANAARCELGGGLSGDFEAPETPQDHFSSGLAKTGNI